MPVSYDCLDRPHQASLISRTLQNRSDQIGSRCLALCPGNADHFQPVCRMPEIRSRNKRHGIPGILHLDHRNITVLWHFHIFLHYQRRRSLLNGFGRKTVSVGIVSANTNEQAVLYNLPGIIHYLTDFLIYGSFYTLISNSFQ